MGDHSFLKIVTIATTNPPTSPIPISGNTASEVRAWKNRLQLHAAVATTQISRTPVLLTVPVNVIASPDSPLTTRKLLTFKAGFEVFIKAIRFLLIYRGSHGQPAVQKATQHGNMHHGQRAG